MGCKWSYGQRKNSERYTVRQFVAAAFRFFRERINAKKTNGRRATRLFNDDASRGNYALLFPLAHATGARAGVLLRFRGGRGGRPFAYDLQHSVSVLRAVIMNSLAEMRDEGARRQWNHGVWVVFAPGAHPPRA